MGRLSGATALKKRPSDRYDARGNRYRLGLRASRAVYSRAIRNGTTGKTSLPQLRPGDYMTREINSFADFWKRLGDAIDDVDALAAIDKDPMVGSIQRQLRFVQQWTTGGARPMQDQLDKLTFGQMASRSVDETDQRLAQELYVLANYLVHWPENQPVRQ
jgi:hypothetical protein